MTCRFSQNVLSFCWCTTSEKKAGKFQIKLARLWDETCPCFISDLGTMGTLFYMYPFLAYISFYSNRYPLIISLLRYALQSGFLTFFEACRFVPFPEIGVSDGVRHLVEDDVEICRNLSYCSLYLFIVFVTTRSFLYHQEETRECRSGI